MRCVNDINNEYLFIYSTMTPQANVIFSPLAKEGA